MRPAPGHALSLRGDQVVVLTFDNLGEAADLERGCWPQGAALGRHPSVTRALPWLLDELGRHRLTATFFVEAINCELYPDAVGEIAARGHDLGVHGWRHEPWSTLPPPHERELLVRATAAFRRLGRSPRGFRPPGGEPTALTESLLRELGYTWWSPSRRVSRSAAAQARPATIAFDWELVDAYFLMERFAELRRRRHDPPAPVAPGALGDRFAARLSADPGAEPRTLVLHPFLMLDDAWREQVARLLALLAGLRRVGTTAVLDGTAFATAAAAGACG
ncbi:MAG: polysaccharide deacetylase family protein [Solirubrobacteraceae bacterium]